MGSVRAADDVNITVEEKPQSDRRTRRILYADDMPELRVIAQVGLANEGHTVECVEDGAQAYERIVADPDAFDIVISDHQMPNMTGLELVRALRALKYRGKIVIFSSDLSADTADAYQALEVDRMLFKPIKLPVLRKLVHDI